MKFETFKLPNHIPVITIVDKDLPSVTALILVRVGSRYETERQSGLAHFIEHMIFKASKQYATSKEITLTIESLGAEINAFTGYEYTGYYIKVPKINFEKALAVLAEIFLNHTLPETEMRKEGEVIIEEIKMHADMPSEKVKQNFFAKVFVDHPLGRDIAGTKQTVSAMAKPDFEKFIAEKYIAENMLVVVSGSFKEKTIAKILSGHFGGVKKGKRAEPANFVQQNLPYSTIWETKPINQQHIVIGGFSYPKDAPEKYAFQTGNSVLAWGMGSMLHQTIREELGLAYYVSLGNRAFSEAGAFAGTMGVDPKNTRKAITAFIDVVKRFLDGKFSERELLRGKNYFVGSLIQDLETSEDLAEWYGLQYLLNGKIETQEEIIAKVEAFSKAEIIAPWQKIISSNNLLISLLGPTPEQAIKIPL